MMRRSDNLLRYHFPACHADVHPDTARFLKVGERPLDGRDHVVWYLDKLGTDTQRPGRDPACTTKRKRLKKVLEPAEDDSQKAYDESHSDAGSEPGELPTATLQGVEVKLPEETVQQLKKKKRQKEKKLKRKTKSDGDHPDMSQQDVAVLITDPEVISREK